MNRKEFLKTGCRMGICSCLGVRFLSPTKLSADEDNPEIKTLKGKLDFIHKLGIEQVIRDERKKTQP